MGTAQPQVYPLFDKEIDRQIEAALPGIIKDKQVFALQTVETSRKVLQFDGNVAVANEWTHAQLTLHNRHYAYNDFLKRASRHTTFRFTCFIKQYVKRSTMAAR